MQYRFPEELAKFPSEEFYEGRLKTGVADSPTLLRPLLYSKFPWPISNGRVLPVVFVPCEAEEDYGGASKKNVGQAELVKDIAKLLRTPKETGELTAEAEEVTRSLSVTVLTPYRNQMQELQHRLPSGVSTHTIDSFQGRESDVIIFSTVRCNASGDIGFVEDARRLNVAWTRAKLGLIIVGDRRTMSTNGLWKRAIDSCTEVAITLSSAQDQH